MTFKYDIEIAKHGNTFISIDHFEIPRQKITFLFGESGIGKSILSKAVYGLLDPARLDVQVNTKPYRNYLQASNTRLIQQNGFFVFQEPSTHLNPLLTLQTQIREGSLKNSDEEQTILRHLWDSESDQPFRDILPVYPQPYRPSGGEKQRILLAMAFKKLKEMQKRGVAGDSLFIFDEPSGSLDNHFRNRFLSLLFDAFREQPFTAMLITHDYSIISEIYQTHKDLKKSVTFKELSRSDDGLQMNDFAPEAYLEWLKGERTAKTIAVKNSEVLLRVKGGYEIFGKRMRIINEANRKKSDDKNSGELRIHRGEMIYLKAASGVGKTTLAKIIMGLQRCKGLKMIIDEKKINDDTPATAWRKHIWAKKIGMVFQHADEALNLNASVEEVFAGLPSKTPITAEFIREQLKRLFDFKIDESFLNKPVKLLSGGQKQRLNLLRTLILDTDLIIMDEPLNGLDFMSISKVITALQQKQKEGKGILMISHNEEIFDTMIPPQSIYHLTIE